MILKTQPPKHHGAFVPHRPELFTFTPVWFEGAEGVIEFGKNHPRCLTGDAAVPFAMCLMRWSKRKGYWIGGNLID